MNCIEAKYQFHFTFCSSENRHNLSKTYRHTSFYFFLLIALCRYCIIFIVGLWQSYGEQVYQCHFSNSIFHFVSLCHILVILTLFPAFSLLLYVSPCFLSHSTEIRPIGVAQSRTWLSNWPTTQQIILQWPLSVQVKARVACLSL